MKSNLSRVLESYGIKYEYSQPTNLYEMYDWYLPDFSICIRYSMGSFQVHDSGAPEDGPVDEFFDVPSQVSAWVQALINKPAPQTV